jgi:hypothetical protein
MAASFHVAVPPAGARGARWARAGFQDKDAAFARAARLASTQHGLRLSAAILRVPGSMPGSAGGSSRSISSIDHMLDTVEWALRTRVGLGL